MIPFLLAAVLAAPWTPTAAEARTVRAHELRTDWLQEVNGPWDVTEPVEAAQVVRSAPRAITATPGVEQWRPLVEQHFAAADVAWALRVMQCESGGDPNAYNPSSASGLFQIKQFWTADYPGDLFDPTHNVATAAAIYYTYGAHHWVCK